MGREFIALFSLIARELLINSDSNGISIRKSFNVISFFGLFMHGGKFGIDRVDCEAVGELMKGRKL